MDVEAKARELVRQLDTEPILARRGDLVAAALAEALEEGRKRGIEQARCYLSSYDLCVLADEVGALKAGEYER